jgi:hypothetical protein
LEITFRECNFSSSIKLYGISIEESPIRSTKAIAVNYGFYIPARNTIGFVNAILTIGFF